MPLKAVFDALNAKRKYPDTLVAEILPSCLRVSG